MKSEKGFSLMEVMLAIALLGIIAVAILSGLFTAYRAFFIADERATAESIARTQMEYIKAQVYSPSATQATYLKIDDGHIPAGYTICSLNRNNQVVEDVVYGVPWNSQSGQPLSADAGLQRVKLVIEHLDKQVLTLEDFKVSR